jgi:hypothetical protein
VVSDVLNLASIRSVRDSVARLPSGAELLQLATRLGLWTESAHSDPPARNRFPGKFSALGADELSDLYAAWISDAGRLAELCSVLSGHRDRLSLQVKAERARARSRMRAANPEVKYSAGALDDAVASDQAIRDLEEAFELVTMLLAAAEGAKEATTVYLTGISREITYRTEQMRSRMYGA